MRTALNILTSLFLLFITFAVFGWYIVAILTAIGFIGGIVAAILED